MTLQQAAQQALDCQDACNLSGVLDSFHRIVMEVLWPEARKQNRGTDFVNTHPIVYLFLDKLASLNGRDTTMDSYHEASEEVKRIAATIYCGAD
jgi:cobalamin biosynthesis protein CobT